VSGFTKANTGLCIFVACLLQAMSLQSCTNTITDQACNPSVYERSSLSAIFPTEKADAPLLWTFFCASSSEDWPATLSPALEQLGLHESESTTKDQQAWVHYSVQATYSEETLHKQLKAIEQVLAQHPDVCLKAFNYNVP